MKCVMILSARSSGSSAIQNLLTADGLARHIDVTRHYEHETLFWVKAAAVLGLPQVKMADSRLPFSAAQGRADLHALLRDNIGPRYTPPADDAALVFDGWRDLCRHYAPVFVEKSPHHLHQWSSLQLVASSLARVPEVDLLMIGLVRNPIDTMHSMWRRWRGLPEENERDWHTAYSNLLRLRERLGERLVILRYEEVVRDPALLDPVYTFLGRSNPRSAYLHPEAVGKWRKDERFGFRLSEATLALAEQYGYQRADMINTTSAPLWPIYRRASKISTRWVRPTLARLKNAATAER